MPLRAFGDVFAQVYGSGRPAVVAMHGWGRRGADFDGVLDGLDAISIDLPGFGATPPPAEAMGARGYAERLIPVIEDLPRPPTLLGHSFGGRVAVVLAAERPDLVSSLVLTGVPLIRRSGATRPPLGYRAIRRAHRMGLVSNQRMEAIRRRRGSADYRAATGVMRDILVTVVNESYEAELSRIRCPVALVWGADDLDVPVSVAEQARALLADAGAPVSLTVLDGVGHLVPTESPGRLRHALEGRPS